MLGWDSAAMAFASRSKRSAGLRVLGEAPAKHLQRDVTFEPRVARAVHLAHPALANRAEHLVVAEPRAGFELKGGHTHRSILPGSAGLPSADAGEAWALAAPVV